MKDYNKVESCLKSFLKNNKRLSYSMALLISFLINGGFSYADEAIQVPLRTEIKTRIEKEQENISQILKEADESMKDIELKIKKLTQRGEFWVKPLEKSYQGFIFANWGNYSKNKNKTESNFNGPEYSASYGKNMGYGQFSNGKYYGEYGIVKNPLEFVDKIDFGANITPKAVTEKTIVEKTVTQKIIEAPRVTPPTVTIATITPPTVSTPDIGTMSEPGAVTVNVTAPGTPPTLSPITVTPVTALNISPAPPTVGDAPTVTAPTVEAPATPAGFTPRLITPPEAPVVNVPNAITLSLGNLPTLTTNPTHYIYSWWNGNDGDTSQTTIVEGNIWKTSGRVQTKGYKAYNTAGNGSTNFTTPTSVPSGGTVNNITGKTTHDKQFTLNDGTYNLSNDFILTLLDVPYSYIGKNVKIYSESGTSIVDLETEGKINVTLEQMKAAKRFSNDNTENTQIYDKVKAYRELSPSKALPLKAPSLYFVNRGKIELGKKLKFLTVTTHTDGDKRINVVENAGTITGINTPGSSQQYGFYHSPDTSQQTSYVYVNSGTMEFHAPESAGAVFSYRTQSLAGAPDAVFVNEGDINIYGTKSMGIGFNTGGDPAAGTGGQGIRKGTKFIFKKPVKLFGDTTVGFYNMENNLTKANESFSTFRAIIGEKDNKKVYSQTQPDGTTKDFTAASNVSGKEEKWVDNAVGIYNKIAPTGKLEIKVPELTIKKYSKDGVGVYAESGKISIEEGNISIEGGEGNIGLYSVGGPIEYKGNITMGPSGDSGNINGNEGNQDGKSNIGLFSKKEITMTGDLVTGNTHGKAKDSTVLYADNGGKITIDDEYDGAVPTPNKVRESKVDIKLVYGKTGENTAIFSKGENSLITLKSKTRKINIDGTKSDGTASNKGVGLFAQDGGKIQVNGTALTNGTEITIKNGASALVSMGKDSNNIASQIDAKYSKIEYDGNGYAVYSDGIGKVDLSGAELTLKGKSTAFDVDLTPSATLPITLDSSTRIHANSDDVIAFNLKQTGGVTLTTVGGIENDIITKIQGKLTGVNLTNLFDGSTSNKYKVAAVDGGTLTVGNLDKSGKKGDTNQDKIDGYQYFNKFLGQRLKATASGKTIKAVLTTEDATERFNGQVVGFEMNSSKNATNETDTAINLQNNSKIIADRNGAGTGAVGAYINYGLVNIDATSKIEVEKDTSTGNTANKGAVGVYAVNGSKVDNKGTIEAGGKESVGILAMAYGESGGVTQKNQFGGKTGEGTFSVTNSGNITMSDDDAIGIYAKNNNTSVASNDYKVTNTGTIEVKKSVSKTAIGIYADKSTVLPKDGTIKIGEKAVGIYAKNSIVGVAGDNLGNIDFNGANGVGIYLKDNSTLLGNKVTLKQSATGTLTGKVGILADSVTNKTFNTEVVADTGVNDVIAYYSKDNGTLTVQADISLNENSTGITGTESEKLVYSGSKTMKLGQKSTGIFGQKNIDFSNGSNIELNGNSSVGVFAKGTSGVINSNGNIKFAKENSIGLYGLNGATVNDNTASMNFTNANAKNNIGTYLAGAKWVDSRTTAYTFNSDHSKNNIYLFAQGSRNNGTDIGSTATLKNEFKVNPSGSASSTAKTIGMYFNTAVKGESTFVDNTLDMTNANAKISVTNSGIGIYTKNATGSSKNNIINKIKVSSTGAGSVGVFTDGDLKLSGTNGLIEAKSNGIGLYGNSGKVTVENEHKVEVTSAGTGMYMTNGSHLSGGTLELENKTTGTTAAGIYYTKGTSSDEVTHNTKLKIDHGSDLLALYVDGGIKLNNTETIKIGDGTNNVGAFVTGGSIFKNKGSITLTDSIKNAIGVYVEDGQAANESGKNIGVYDYNTSGSGTPSIGMIAKAASGKTAKVINLGNIVADGEAIGMDIENDSIGENSGNITAKNREVSGVEFKSIGAYINGANAKFTNSGTISADNIGLALKDTTANKILNSGTLKLTKSEAVGVYANNSIVDFNIAPTVESTVDKTVALYATGNTKIAGQITTAAGKSHVGVYAEGNAEFQSGSKVTVGDGIEHLGTTYYGIGIYTKSGYNKAANVDLKLNGLKTIGFYLGATGTTGSTVTHTGTIDVGSGIGTFIPKYSKFVAQNTTFNVGNGGTAVYLKGGEADLGSTGTVNINFTGSGRAVYQDGGTLTTGAGLHITGTGSFLTLKNANSIINSIVNVGENGIGINGIYDSNAQDYTLKLDSPTGHIKLSGNKATGIAAVAKNTVASKKVDIINKGTIETISGEKTTGIYGKGANIENATGAKINIGAKGVGIYTTNYYDNSMLSLTNTTLKNNGEINLTGDEATGIVAVKAHTTQDFIGGKITGTKDKLVGMFFDNSAAQTKVKDFDISLGTNAKGLIFKDGQDFTITSSSTNKVTIGNTTNVASRGIGISALGVNGTVSNTEVKVGKNSLGLYAKDKKLTFDLATGKLESSDASRSSILAYADGNNSEVALNGGGTLKVGANGIALGTKGGKITANATTTVEVDGVKGLGAYVENGGSISNNFDIKVKSAEGIGMYAKGGALASVAKVSELKGNKSIGYVFENITNAINMPNSVQLTDTNATGQVGVAVKGTGAGLTVAGVSVVGSKNIGIYNETTGAVTNNGALNVADSTGDSSIGIYSQGGTVTSTGNATIGKNSIAIYGKNTAATLNGNLNIGEKGVGLYVDNTATSKGDTAVNGNITVGANGAIGIQTTNSKVNLTGDLSVASGDSKGIFSMGAGNVETTGNINVGNNSVGIYKNGSGEIKTALGSIGKTLTVADSGYGVFSKGAKLINNMNVIVGVDAIGAYVDGNDLTSTGTVTVADKGVGLLVKGSGKTLTSTGNITVGSNNSVGLYAGDNANIAQSGNITVANNNGIGVYSKGSGNISTVGAMTVGKDSIGVYKDGKGTMNINASSPIQTMTIAEKGYGLYYKGNSRADSIINSNMNMTLGKEAVGIYAKNTTVNHTGDITVGETTIGSSGFTTPSDNKNSIGIFGDNSNINFKGNMLVDKPLSVGIYGANGGSITVKSGSTITVKNGATGIMTGSKVENITLESGSTLNVDGKVDTNVYTNATKSNVSFGIAAYSGLIDNQGTINVTNGATGIYLAGTASLKNGATGTINIDATSKSTAKPDTKASAELGGIKVTDKGVVTINNKVINGGTLNVKGALNMEGLGLDVSTGKTVVDAKSISGVAEVLPSFSRGNSEQKVTIKDVFRTGVVGAFSGDVKSKSVSWIAKISKEPGSSTTTSDITMVRIPYNSLISGERYKNLASGLEDIRSKIGKDSSSPIFKSLDNISSHRDFARAVANIRGDVYSNIQERMKTVENSFDKSYNELLSSYNKTRNVDKFSVIYTGGEHKDNTLGVSGYEYKSTGVLYLNDREAFTYGGKYGWSAGIVGSNFEFKGDTNKGSKERVISGKLGLHYQAPLNKDDDNARLRWLTRGEITVNNHRTKRYSQVGADTYQNKASFYSTELSWKNIISYDYDINTNWTVKPYTGIDISYGHIFNIKEKNEGLPLEVKGKDYFVITPNVGVETKYVLPLGAIHQLFTKVDTEFSYDVTKLYHGVNQAKMKNASTGYYDLSKPERRRARVAVGAELGLEKENAYGVTFRAEYQGYKKNSFNYGVRLNYKF